MLHNLCSTIQIKGFKTWKVKKARFEGECFLENPMNTKIGRLDGEEGGGGCNVHFLMNTFNTNNHLVSHGKLLEMAKLN